MANSFQPIQITFGGYQVTQSIHYQAAEVFGQNFGAILGHSDLPQW